MALDVIRVVSQDTYPAVTLTLKDRVTGDPVDVGVGGRSVYLRFRAAGTEPTLSVIPTSVLGPGADGRVVFDFANGVLDVPPGEYEAEVVVDDGADVQTVYEVLRFRVRERFP